MKDIPEGVFPGEVRRLPGPRERDALSLLLGAADLFLALEFPPPSSPKMILLGWGLTQRRGEALSAAAFDPAGRFLGAAFFPSDRAGEELGKFLATLTGREPGPAAVRLRAYGEVHRGERGAGAAESAARLAEAFREARARAARVAPPPARFLPRYPGGSTLMKVFVVILVIALAGFANLALVRRWRQRQEDTDSLPAGRRRFGRFD